MTYKVSRAKLLEWINEKQSLDQNMSLNYLANRFWVDEFFRKNNSAFKDAFDGHNNLVKDFYELEEDGKVKHIQKFKESTKTIKAKYFWQKDTSETSQIPDGHEPVLKEGKTKEDFDKASMEFLNALVEVNSCPITINRIPFVLR